MPPVLACTLPARWLEQSSQWACVPRRLGLENVQLLVGWGGGVASWDRAFSCMQLLQQQGLRPVSLWLKPDEGVPPLTPGELARLLELLRQQVRWLVLPAGVLPGWEQVEQEAAAPAWSGPAQAALDRLEELFCSQKVEVLLDVAHPLTENPKATAGVLARWNNPKVRLWLDLGAQALRFPYSQVEVALQRWFGQLGGVGLRDAVPEMPLAWTPSPGQGGEIDFARCWQILSAGGFQGLASVIQGRRRGWRRELTPQQWEAELREGLEHLRHCGWPVDVLSCGS